MKTLRQMALLGAAALLVAAAPGPAAYAQDATDTVRKVAGELPDGAGPYRLAAPPNWNGVVILDLDFALASESPMYKRLYALGYAGAGSTRGRAEQGGTAVDNPQRIARQLDVLRRFEETFGEPKRVIALGFSGAGGLAVALLEEAPERIDGAVGACIITGAVGWFNTKLDLAFAAKTLLAPDSDLPLQNIPQDLAAASRSWTDMLTAAQQTPEGRARIALASALGQSPIWSNPETTEPDPTDLQAAQQAVFETLTKQFGAEIGAHIRVRRDFEGSAGGPISWNTGVDYRQLFATAVDPQQQQIVKRLYRTAGLDLDADLERLNAAPRETANPGAVKVANQLLGVSAQPRTPVLLLHTTGDALSQPATLEAYTRRAPPGLVRTAFVRNAGHCTFSTAEKVAAVETLNQRLETGRWPDTSAAAMNARAKQLDSSEARFTDLKLGPYPRAFYVDDKPPSGGR